MSAVYIKYMSITNGSPTPYCRISAAKKLQNVYVGNIMDKKSNSTYCPECGQSVIERIGFFTTITGVKDGRCNHCGAEINVAGV